VTNTLVVANGHSIVRNGNAFQSTGLVQEVVWTGGSPPFIRTGIHNPRLDWDSPSAYLGGQTVVVKALYRATRHGEDALIIAGRPRYLNDVAQDFPDVSEGTVMLEEFRLRGNPTGNVVMVDSTKTTEDETHIVLSRAEEYESVVMIMMGFRIPRAAMLLVRSAAAQDKMKLLERISFVSAEQHVPEMQPHFETMLRSRAYRSTMAMEYAGMANMLAGAYVRGGQT
jgi:hypothetical protein